MMRQSLIGYWLGLALDALGLAGATQQGLPAHQHFVNLPLRREDRVVLLAHGVVGTVVHRHVDPEEVEDVYVVQTEDGRLLVAPEGDVRLALEAA